MEILRAATLASKSPFLVCCVRVEKSFEQFPSLVSAFLRPCGPSKGEHAPSSTGTKWTRQRKMIESKRAFAMEKKFSRQNSRFFCFLAIDFLFDGSLWAVSLRPTLRFRHSSANISQGKNNNQTEPLCPQNFVQ